MKNKTPFVVGSNNAKRWNDALNEKRKKIIRLVFDLKQGLFDGALDKDNIAITLDNI